MEKLTVKSWYSQETPVTIELGRYGSNDTLAISLWCDEGPFARLTVNLANHKPPLPYAYVDMNNNPWAEEFIQRYGLGENTGDQAQSGYCWYPLYKFDLDKLRQIEKDGGIVDAG